MSRAYKYWFFTLNNYTQADVGWLSGNIPWIKYIVFGKEVDESGTPYLLGCVCFGHRMKFGRVKRILGSADTSIHTAYKCGDTDQRIHVEPTKVLDKSIEYCKKEGDWFEKGAPPEGPPR